MFNKKYPCNTHLVIANKPISTYKQKEKYY